MKSIIALAGVSALLFATAAHAGDTAVEAPIRQFVDGFNKGDLKAAKASLVAAPSIVDEVAPFHWDGPKAFDTWVADLTRSEAAEGRSDGQVTMDPARREEVTGGRAYVLVPSTYIFKLKGATMHEVSLMTYVLAKGKSGWKIELWTWSGPRASAVK